MFPWISIDPAEAGNRPGELPLWPECPRASFTSYGPAAEAGKRAAAGGWRRHGSWEGQKGGREKRQLQHGRNGGGSGSLQSAQKNLASGDLSQGSGGDRVRVGGRRRETLLGLDQNTASPVTPDAAQLHV